MPHRPLLAISAKESRCLLFTVREYALLVCRARLMLWWKDDIHFAFCSHSESHLWCVSHKNALYFSSEHEKSGVCTHTTSNFRFQVDQKCVLIDGYVHHFVSKTSSSSCAEDQCGTPVAPTWHAGLRYKAGTVKQKKVPRLMLIRDAAGAPAPK